MATTLNRAYPYPDGPTSPNNVPLDLQLLAEAVDVDLDTLGTEVTDSDTATETGALATAIIYSAAEITLPAGKWLVTAAGAVVNTTVADTVAAELWNATASAVVAGSRGVAALTNTTATVPVATRPKVITLTASTALRLRCIPNGGSTVRIESQVSAPAVWLHAARMG